MAETHSSICYFIPKDMKPVATINSVGFRRMIKEFEPCYMVPDRKTLLTNFIPEMYKHEKTMMCQVMHLQLIFSLCIHVWCHHTFH